MKNQKGFANLVLVGIIIILVALSGYLLWSKKITPSVLSEQPVQQPEQTVTQTVTKTGEKIFSNQYMTFTVPTGWTVEEANHSVYNEDCVSKKICTTPAQANKIEPNPAAVNITKGNYILYINTRTGQSSGVEGGRFSEIAGGAPSVDAVENEAPAEPCEMSSVVSAMNVNGISGQRTDFYTGSNNRSGMCKTPANGKEVWYFSYFGAVTSPDTGAGYFNYYNVPDIQLIGWVVTMAYNSEDVNSLPVKGSADLNQALSDMSGILKTLKINAPVAYVPAVARTIKTMNNTAWTVEASEGINSSVVGCTDTAHTNNFNESSVRASYHMESGAADNNNTNTMYKSADIQTRIGTIEGILTNNGWSKCNSVLKNGPASSDLKTTDNIDVYKNGNDFVDVDSNYAENINIRIPMYGIWLTFYTLK